MRKKNLILTGMILLALVLTGGTFAYTYSGFSMTTLDSAAAIEAFTTYEPSADQPDWNDVLPWGEPDQEILRPDGAGDQTTIPSQYPSSGEHYDKVDEDSADDWDTYLYSTTKQFRTDLYSIGNHVEGEGDIIGVTVVFRIAADATGTAYASAAIKTNGQVFTGTQESQSGSSFADKSYTWTNNPNTGAAWTWDEIDSLQAGIDLAKEANSVTAACTQVYVIVDYSTIVFEGEMPEGDLFDITPHEGYTGDLLVKIYLTNTSALIKAYQYVNMKLYVENSLEAGKTPDYQVLSVENGVVLFNIEGSSAASYTVKLIGGSYRLISGDPDDWGEGWIVTPELYCEVSQR